MSVNISAKDMKKLYDCWKRNFENYKIIVKRPNLSLGEYSMVAQSVFYSMIQIIAIVQKYKNEKKEERMLRELNDCAVSIRMHILCFRKIMPDPDALETLDYINSLYKRIPTNSSSDEELEELYRKKIEDI